MKFLALVFTILIGLLIYKLEGIQLNIKSPYFLNELFMT